MVVPLTDRLHLREFTMDDAPALNAIESLPEVARDLGLEPTTLADAEAMLAQMMAWMHADPRQHIGWPSRSRGTMPLWGGVGLGEPATGRARLSCGVALPHGTTVPIVLTSAAVARDGLDQEIDAFLGKPFDLEDLLDLVGQLIGSP